MLGLENAIAREKDPFVQKGLQLLVDGNEPDTIRDILELDMNAKENRDYRRRDCTKRWAVMRRPSAFSAPLWGLIHVMENLTDPALLGKGIATAFVATIYGVASANLIFLPIANKLKAHIFADNSSQGNDSRQALPPLPGTKIQEISSLNWMAICRQSIRNRLWHGIYDIEEKYLRMLIIMIDGWCLTLIL